MPVPEFHSYKFRRRKGIDDLQTTTVTPKFKHLDRVRIVNYGHQYWENNWNGTVTVHDLQPELVGKEAFIEEVSIPQPNRITYSLNIIQPDGSTRFQAWFTEHQLELVKAVKISYE